MKKILITGASGYIGARLFADLKQIYDVTGTFHNLKLTENLVQLDITSLSNTDTLIAKLKPDYIVHNAAFPVTPKDEKSKIDLENINYTGMENIVNSSNKYGSKLIFISSAVALNTNDIYGKSKAYGEDLCFKALNTHLVVRPHTVFGYSPNTINDRSFNRILKNITQKIPAIYDTSWKFQPTYIGHISEVIRLFIEGHITEKLVSVAFEDLKSKYDIGNDILKSFGIKVEGIDEHSTRPTIKLDLSYFKSLNLSPKTYEEMVDRMITEIRALKIS